MPPNERGYAAPLRRWAIDAAYESLDGADCSYRIKDRIDGYGHFGSHVSIFRRLTTLGVLRT